MRFRIERKGIKADGIFLLNVRFADDLMLFSKNSFQMENPVNELNRGSVNACLEINMQRKT